MITIPEEFCKQISVFAPLFTKKVFKHVKILLMGSILVVGRRTVCSALRAMGLEQEKRFHKYHRVLSQAKWSVFRAGRILLELLINNFVPTSEPLVFGIDETLERRWGRKINARRDAGRGVYRDAVRSSHSYFVKCSGLRWMGLMLLTPISWTKRIWALPFLTVLAPSERYYQQRNKKQKKLTDWARQMLLQLKRWLPNRKLIVVADSSYACYSLLDAVRHHVCMITPLRLDARLFDVPPPQSVGKRGPKPKIGKRQPSLKQRLEQDATQWQILIIPQWYGKSNKVMQIATGTALWYKSNDPLVPLRWVLIKDPTGQLAPHALLCTDLDKDAQNIINYFICRWTIEVTFEETRRHLGVESQRQWSDLAIARTTPVLMGLFSLVTLWADKLQKQQGIEAQRSAWYLKKYPTFSDAMALVRQQLWQDQKFSTSPPEDEVNNLNDPLINHLCNMLARAA